MAQPPQQPGQYGAPPGQYGAPPGQYGAPPPGQYGAPPGQYGAPPPGQYGAPPGQYGAPPPGQYGAPPPGQYGAPPPGQYGQYPGQQYQQYGAPQPAPAPGGDKGKGKGAAAAAAPAPPMGAAPMYSAPGMPPQGAGFAPAGMQPQLVPMSSLPQGPFVPGADAEVLWNACKGLGTREADLIRIIGYRPRAQLVQIAAAFQQAHSKSLAKVLHSETSGHFRQLLLKLILPLEELLADLVHEAIAGLGTKDLALIDVITQLTPQEMAMLKEFYPRKYKESLAKAVAGDTSGDYRKLLLALIEGTRQPPGAVGDAVKVEADAERFYRAGAGRLGTDEAALINLVATNSSEHLQLVSQAYQRVHGKTLEDAIRSETSGHFQDTLIALVNTRAMHFARRIKYACDRPGTLDTLLVNIFAMNDKLQLKAIGYAYQAMFKASMPNVVSSDTSGDYRNASPGSGRLSLASREMVHVQVWGWGNPSLTPS